MKPKRKLSITITFDVWQPEDEPLGMIAADINDALQTGLTDVGIDAMEDYNPEQISVVVEKAKTE